MFLKSKAQKHEEKHALEIMTCFAEGKISTDEFWDKYKICKTIQELLINDKTRPSWDFSGYFISERLLEVIDINNLEHRYELFEVVKRYFWRRKEELVFFNKDVEKYLFLQEMLPDWVDVRDAVFLQNIINSAPKDFSDMQKLNWGKEKIRELFRYEKKPPEWLQNPEWPIVGGKPLVFSHQEPNEDSSDFERYYFYDPDTKEEIVVEQFS